MDFIAIDFETANNSRSSVCSIGIVKIESGLIKKEIHTYIDPQDEFYYYNTMIHGITEEMVKGAPTFTAFWPEFKALIEEQTLVAHNASFDMSVLRHALNDMNEPFPSFNYGCTYVFSKKVWPSLYNYKLSTVADHLGIHFKHHNALEDARAAALITLAALRKSETETLQELSDLHNLTLGMHSSSGYNPAGAKKSGFNQLMSSLKSENTTVDESHPFYNATVVFTGKLNSMSRIEAAQLVVNCGGLCKNSITREINYLVIGDSDLTRYSEGFKSSKLKKVEKMINQRLPVEIVGENEFLRMIF